MKRPIVSALFRKLMLVSAACLAASALNFANADEFTNFVGMKFVDIPAGDFYMGSCKLTHKNAVENKRRAFLGLPLLKMVCPSGAPIDPNAEDRETPQHAVSINTFQLGKYEVTVGEFKAYIVETKKYEFLTDEFMEANDSGDQAPVTLLSWSDVQDYVAWLNHHKPKTDHGVYRLPSEAEWEYAARAGTNTAYSFSDFPVLLGTYAWYMDNSEKKVHPVGEKPANAFGLFDMHGNVWEWTEDCAHTGYQNAPADGSAWLAKKCKAHIVRGGSWGDGTGSARSAYRFSRKSEFRMNTYGFRLVRELPH